jgi:hypothetical protein
MDSKSLEHQKTIDEYFKAAVRAYILLLMQVSSILLYTSTPPLPESKTEIYRRDMIIKEI